MRRYGEEIERGRRYTFRPGVYLILPRSGKLLLTHQMEPEPEFQLPGGGIDPGESVFEALHRECMEETGWRVSNPRRLCAYRRFTFMPEYDMWAEKISHIYVATPVSEKGPPTEAGHSVHWFDPVDAVSFIASSGDSAVLERYLKGEFGPFRL